MRSYALTRTNRSRLILDTTDATMIMLSTLSYRIVLSSLSRFYRPSKQLIADRDVRAETATEGISVLPWAEG